MKSENREHFGLCFLPVPVRVWKKYRCKRTFTESEFWEMLTSVGRRDQLLICLLRVRSQVLQPTVFFLMVKCIEIDLHTLVHNLQLEKYLVGYAYKEKYLGDKGIVFIWSKA
jgi:hypothetical protein